MHTLVEQPYPSRLGVWASLFLASEVIHNKMMGSLVELCYANVARLLVLNCHCSGSSDTTAVSEADVLVELV
jgi:hypothetical protein